MKLFASLACVVLMLTCGYVIGGERIDGSGVEKSEPRDVGAFTKVRLDGTPDVTITVGGPGAQREVVVSGDDNIVPLIHTDVKDGTLVIGSKDNYNGKLDLKVKITVESLEAIDSRGTGDVVASGVKSPRFAVDLSGTGDVKLAGDGETIDCKLSGTGDIDASAFNAAKATTKLSGTGDIKIRATETLEAGLSGTGDVEYVGSPKMVSRHVSGTGSVRGK